MAFFGLTQLGYQTPLRAVSLPGNGQGTVFSQTADSGKHEESHIKLPALVPRPPTVSHGKYQEMRRRHQDLRTPKQTQRLPATAAQQYGWWLPQDPKCKAESVHPWIGSQRYPHINSPMTLFVQQMYLTDKSFRLF
ncbi:testis-expressed protein 49 [Xenopus laevis]|uniref:Uncharacterized protein n=2 Tax=Xenopus laevis TaxID=8355 RepID=A0A974DIQ5_XENLA|nr:testis-expressed protein 49 [Xenopus laevis]OCT92753.1 hypothetical protein XELAEV_18015816mg [Xenopus laevis]